MNFSSNFYISALEVALKELFCVNIKVGDFGLCRHLNEALYTTRGGRLPIKWMAIESLKLYECTTKSDVYVI